MTGVARQPSRFGTVLALSFALMTVLVTALSALSGAVVAVVGTAALSLGLALASRQLVSLGGALLLVGVLFTGYVAAGPGMLLIGAITGVVAWDAAGTAIDIGQQLGRETATARVETVHAVASLVAGSVAGGIGYAVFAVGGAGLPVLALLLLAGGAVALVGGLR